MIEVSAQLLVYVAENELLEVSGSKPTVTILAVVPSGSLAASVDYM